MQFVLLQLGPVMLQEIDIGPNRQQGCLLPCSDQDRSHLLFVVGNSRFCAGGNMHAGVAVNNTELSRSPATMLTQNADVARCQSTSVWPKLEHMSRQLEPDQER